MTKKSAVVKLETYISLFYTTLREKWIITRLQDSVIIVKYDVGIIE